MAYERSGPSMTQIEEPVLQANSVHTDDHVRYQFRFYTYRTASPAFIACRQDTHGPHVLPKSGSLVASRYSCMSLLVRMPQIPRRLDERTYPLFERLQLYAQYGTSSITHQYTCMHVHTYALAWKRVLGEIKRCTDLWEPPLDLPVRDQNPSILLDHDPLGNFRLRLPIFTFSVWQIQVVHPYPEPTSVLHRGEDGDTSQRRAGEGQEEFGLDPGRSGCPADSMVSVFVTVGQP
jgi:hypothetical protein